MPYVNNVASVATNFHVGNFSPPTDSNGSECYMHEHVAELLYFYSVCSRSLYMVFGMRNIAIREVYKIALNVDVSLEEEAEKDMIITEGYTVIAYNFSSRGKLLN